MKTAITRLLGFVFIIISMSACHPDSTERNYFSEEADGSVYLLSSIVMQTDSALIGTVCRMVVEDKLIVSYTGNYHYRYYTIKGDSLLWGSGFLLRGRGPNEMQIPEIEYNERKKELLVYAPYNTENKLFYIEASDFSKVPDSRLWRREVLPGDVNPLSLCFVNDTLILNQGTFLPYAMFTLTCLHRDSWRKKLDFPYPSWNAGLDSADISLLYDGKIKKHPDKSSFVYSAHNSKYVFIFDLGPEGIVDVKYLSRTLPEAVPVQGNPYMTFTMKEEMEYGCRCLYVTENNIYLGYNHITYKQTQNDETFKGYPFYYFDRIAVFDWEGNFIKRLELDTPVSFFTVTRDDRYLYASTIDRSEEDFPTKILRFGL